jgi:hypothetical protein
MVDEVEIHIEGIIDYDGGCDESDWANEMTYMKSAIGDTDSKAAELDQHDHTTEVTSPTRAHSKNRAKSTHPKSSLKTLSMAKETPDDDIYYDVYYPHIRDTIHASPTLATAFLSRNKRACVRMLCTSWSQPFNVDSLGILSRY